MSEPPPRYGLDDLLTASAAAEEATRSVRTIRRAYRCGALAAHRDGNGRSVRIRYRDLRVWMMAEPATPLDGGEGSAPPRRQGRRRRRTANVRLLEAARSESAEPTRAAP